MRVPLRWLRDYVDVPDLVVELAERLTLAGLEVIGARSMGLPLPAGLRLKSDEVGPVWDRDKIVIGEVLNVERHPNADRLSLPAVNYGAAEPKTVVTGAPNIKVGDRGQKVIVALSGAVLFDGHASERTLRELKPSKIRGVPSDAMVCSAYELGISDEHEGIILLEKDAPVGTPLADFMGDLILELDVTPNLARCLCMIGVAREVAALTGQKLRLPPVKLEAGGEPIAGKVTVAIDDSSLSARYAAALIRGVEIRPSPGWMQRRLLYAGMRPINNIVDITNYVLLEWGQPLHAFDYDTLVRRAGGGVPAIRVRPARASERLKTLDGVLRELTPENLIIADTAGPIAIAGVMGGAETEVGPTTKNVLLESANFNPVSVRRTIKAFNLPSEASVRFSRGVHPAIVKPAVERAAELMRQHASGEVASGLVDVYVAPPAPQVAELKMSEVRRLLGVDFPMEEAVRTLESLEFTVEKTGPETLRATVPQHRLDIQSGSADLIEELARIHGYDRLPATLLADRLPEQHTNRPLVLEERVRDILVNLGLQEVITYALTEPSREAPLAGPDAEYVRLLNPISSERVVMRRHVLPGVVEVAAANLRNTESVRLFEIGAVFLPKRGEKLPDEPRRLALFLTGRRATEFWGESDTSKKPEMLDFYDVKGIVEALASDLHLPKVAYQPASGPLLHPGRAASLLLDGRSVGLFGQIHPKVAEGYGLGNRAVLVGEFDLEAILAAVPDRYLYTPIPRFPAALRDVAVIVDDSVPADRVEVEIRAAGGSLLTGGSLLSRVRLFDLYRGESIPAGKKSLAYALTYQAEDRTLTDKEVDRAHKKIEDRLKHVLKAQIRGQDGVG